MTEIWTQAALWLGLALLASMLSIWLRVATALSEIVVGTIAQLFIGALLGSALVAAVFGSAVVPTLIANAFFLPRHLLPSTASGDKT